MAKLEERTSQGWLSAVGVESELLREALPLVVDASARNEMHGSRVRLAGSAAYFKKGPLRGGSRLRHALRLHAAAIPPPRVREFHNLNWLREHAFEAPRPLAAGWIARGGMPAFQFLFTEIVPDTVTLESFLSDAPDAERAPVVSGMASDVARLHALGFIHHDLFPRNILLRRGARDARAIYLDAWAGGPGHRLRGPAYDLACFFLYAPQTMRPTEPREFLDAYVRERARHGAAPDRDRLFRSIARQRARLARKLSRRSGELRGHAPPSADWSVSA